MNVSDFVKLIETNNRNNYVYHFTDTANLPTIRNFGLLSKLQSMSMGLVVPRPGGNEISRSADRGAGIFDDVSLCMVKNHPMAFRCRTDGRHPSQIYLGIDPKVLLVPGVRVSFGVANSRAAMVLPIQDAINTFDADILYSSWQWSPATQARLAAAEKVEILVPKLVHVSLIKKQWLVEKNGG